MLLKLPVADSVGVAGPYLYSPHSPSMDMRKGISCWTRMVGFWCMALGDAAGVSIACEMYWGW